MDLFRYLKTSDSFLSTIDSRRRRTMEQPRATVCLTFDFDAISIWIGPMGATSPSMISRGEFGAVGVERILRMLEQRGIKATFFVTGHTAETYPASLRAIVAAGHEVGHHGYLHENPCKLTRDEEERVLLRGLEALDSVVGSCCSSTGSAMRVP
jgi:hypothetical protein